VDYFILLLYYKLLLNNTLFITYNTASLFCYILYFEGLSMAERKEMTDEQVIDRGVHVISRIKIEFETERAAYVDKDDMKFVVNRKRNRADVVHKEFEDKMLRQFNASVVDVGGGRVAVVKR
jgi:hemerythrin-like domain-containing protein